MSKETRWVWCPTCNDWIGERPPQLPNYWSLDKTAALHTKGTGHKVIRVPFSDLVFEERKDGI